MKALISLVLLSLIGCTKTYYGEVVGEDVRRYRDHHDYLMELESEYIIVLENLMLAPEDAFLLNEKDRVEKRLLQAKEESALFWKQKETAISNWEKNLYETQTQQLFSDSLAGEAKKRLEKQLKKNGVNLNLME